MGGGVAALQSDGQLLSQGFAEAGLARPGRSVQEHHPVAGDDVGVDSFVGQEEGSLHEPQELGLDIRIVDEIFPGTLEFQVGHDPVLGGGNLFLSFQADLFGLCRGGLQLVAPGPAEIYL